MSMRGDIISAEYQKMVWVHDKNGKEYACYAKDLHGNIRTREELSPAERDTCLDLSLVVADTW